MNKKGDKISILKRKIKDIDWEEVSDDWVVDKLINKFTKMTKSIKLNPHKDCDKDSNPLYMHKGWLEKLYKGLNLSDGKIAKLCEFRNRRSISGWRKRHGISTKEEVGYFVDQGYKKILMPLGYQHPQIKPTPSNRQRIREHRLVMEKFLSQNPHLENSKKYLILGKYLDISTIVHHKNRDKMDNRIENLWLYPNMAVHHLLAKASENNCLGALIKLKQITFSDGEYKFDRTYDYRNRYNKKEIQEIIKPVEFKIPFEDIDEIRDEIKKLNWERISQNWNVKKHHFYNRHQDNYSSIQTKLNPYEDCNKDLNPLYMHKDWVEEIVNDPRFNLTDSRLGALCGISSVNAQYWRNRVHKILTKHTKMGVPKTLDSDGYIRIKIPKSYKNPFARKLKMPYDVIREHRYNAERHLVKSSNLRLKSECLADEKYLLPECKVHHINLDRLDNSIKNLFVTREHEKVHEQLFTLTKQSLNSGFLIFDSGKYFLL